jgi:hypothetical protein
VFDNGTPGIKLIKISLYHVGLRERKKIKIKIKAKCASFTHIMPVFKIFSFGSVLFPMYLKDSPRQVQNIIF